MKLKEYTKSFIALIFSLSLHVHSNEYVEPCLPSSQFNLGGLAITDNYAAIEKKFGTPKSIGTYSATDDGGEYIGKSLEYDRTEIHFEKLRGIQLISTANPKIELKLGVRVGMNINEVSERLHFNTLKPTNIISLNVCGVTTDENLLKLYFSESVLNKIEISSFGP